MTRKNKMGPRKQPARSARSAPSKRARAVGRVKSAPGGKKSASPRRLQAPAAAGPSVLVVNMIPNSLSGESNQDSEPTITVNRSNPLHLAATAFTPDPSEGSLAPIYVSSDGGNTWGLNSIVPSVAKQSMTADITVAFGSNDRLYAGIIRLPVTQAGTRLNILRADDFMAATPMKVLVDRTGRGVDQPYVQALPLAGQDHVFVGDNDFNSPGATATVDESLNGGVAKPSFSQARIEKRATSGQDGPPVRPCLHTDGTVYAVFHSWRSFDQTTGDGVADVVLVRDDGHGSGNPSFTDLVDPGDGLAGKRVAQGVKFNFGGYLGLQRTGGDVAIAVDPNNSSTVYVAYNDNDSSVYLLHLVRSPDRGVTWSADLRTLPNALNAALAVNGDGTVALLYQQLTGSGAAQSWVTACDCSQDGVAWQTVVLAQTPASTPPKQFDPYLGDYEHLTAVDKTFYGIFSASNIPDKSNFPQDVTYLRNADFTTQKLLDIDGVTVVAPSIDPFFFKMTV